ncbi:UAA transporter [Neoconidiobolus thromboides FSU 785]|nr:UAA transporter [Neoconidiobolus thromboides FSU 785]
MSISSNIATTTLSSWIYTLSFIIGGCCSNAYALEMIVRDAPSSGNLITFAQFLLVATEGLLNNMTLSSNGIPKLKDRKIPLYIWCIMVVLFFSSSQINNIAFAYDIPMSLHIIFRSGSLITNMLMGVILLKKRYKLTQIFSILIVTAGIIITTLSSVNTKVKTLQKEVNSTFSQQVIGIGILTLGLFLASLLGIVQEVTYKKYGKHWREGLFYTHALSLPIFLLFSKDILTQWNSYLTSDNLPFNGTIANLLNQWNILHIPKLVFYLALNVGTQYFCVSGVQKLSSMSTALTLNLVLTMRKMISIVFSVLYFNQNVSFNFILGTILAFSGTLIYTMASRSSSNSNDKKVNVKEEKLEKQGNQEKIKKSIKKKV